MVRTNGIMYGQNEMARVAKAAKKIRTTIAVSSGTSRSPPTRWPARAGHLVGGERLVPEETAMVVLIFLAAFATLAISFWPYMIPFVLTIDEAAAPQSRFIVLGRGDRKGVV